MADAQKSAPPKAKSANAARLIFAALSTRTLSARTLSALLAQAALAPLVILSSPHIQCGARLSHTGTALPLKPSRPFPLQGSGRRTLHKAVSRIDAEIPASGPRFDPAAYLAKSRPDHNRHWRSRQTFRQGPA
ncbi:hypothetical protein M2A_2229 [Tepidicaulis marinus]|uniref:Uncharacterized protein n=1 Tax=Tepidicaulis marinus TaxID=1333998 RepID=A0A081BCG2_9HYPH|nr:hypothetical protein M2A_2229 [Tepidicaulis marinus]